ncbi:MAG TPA: endonuclease III [Planctomycetota bacterium]|nr:endonuclease III [Planctomycetota bacterium]
MKSSKSSTPERLKKIVRTLARVYGDARCALVHSNALELLVATILSAQCTDVRVNLVTAELFKKYRTAKDYADADLKDLEQRIRSTGFYHNKAKSIRGAAKLLVEKHGGEVPDAMEALLELPGVARKTANVVLGTWFKKATGVVVDTHVQRISRRLQLTREVDPKKIERDLMRLLPKEEWIDFSHRVIWHGRRICAARKPKCGECPIAADCPSAGRIA